MPTLLIVIGLVLLGHPAAAAWLAIIAGGATLLIIGIAAAIKALD